MIEYRKGNLLDVTEGIILHGCNAQGVMGSGVALAIKQRYPEAYKEYMDDHVYLGSISCCWVTDDLMIINGITQEYYGKDGKRYVNYKAICDVFTEAISKARMFYFVLNFPKIGAGLGGGDWGIIEQLIDDCDPDDKVKKVCWEL